MVEVILTYRMPTHQRYIYSTFQWKLCYHLLTLLYDDHNMVWHKNATNIKQLNNNNF